MNDGLSKTHDYGEEVNIWVERLIAAEGEQKGIAAGELSRLGVLKHRSVRPRGSLRQAARNELPVPEQLDEVIKSLQDTARKVRCQVALALGEWGDESAAVALAQLLHSDPDQEVQLYCVAALRTIGGPVSASALGQAAAEGHSEALRMAAISAIGELATGGQIEDTELPPPLREAAPLPTKGVTRSRETIRTRGGAVHTPATGIERGLITNLEKVAADGTVSEFLRRKAAEVLVCLNE